MLGNYFSLKIKDNGLLENVISDVVYRCVLISPLKQAHKTRGLLLSPLGIVEDKNSIDHFGFRLHTNFTSSLVLSRKVDDLETHLKQ